MPENKEKHINMRSQVFIYIQIIKLFLNCTNVKQKLILIDPIITVAERQNHEVLRKES